MPEFIKSYQNNNKPIVDGSSDCLSISYFNLIRLKAGEKHETFMGNYESVWVIMSGNCDISVDGESFEKIGKRPHYSVQIVLDLS